MANQLTSNAEALRLFFTEDVYLVQSEIEAATSQPAQVLESSPGDEIVKPIEKEAVLPLPPMVVEEPKPTFNKDWDFEYLGKNQKGILILVNDLANKVSSTQGTELLRKLVKAIELTNNDFALVNYANYDGATFDDLSNKFSCQLLLSFGVDAAKLGLNPQPLHQLFEEQDKRLIFTSNLHDLDTDQNGKKSLWATLQKIK